MRNARNAPASLVLALAIVLAPLCAQAQRAAPGGEKIEIRAIPIESFDARMPERRQFGALEFRGGLELSSSHRQFGGLSGIRVAPDGAQFLALSDKAQWLRGRIVYRDGRPAGIANAEIAPLLGPDGRPITARGWYDSEALADDGSMVYVAFERVHRIVRFDYGKDGLLARGQPVAVPPDFARLPSNRGIECLVVPQKGMPLAGALIAISERGQDHDGNIKGFILGGARPGNFTVKPSDEFDIVDCAIAPNADLLILERRFSWRRGVAMRIRRVPLSTVAPGAVVDGPALIEADMGYQIDNMEGLSLHRSASGELVLTLVSDDNFSMIQRTLLLQFTLLDK